MMARKSDYYRKPNTVTQMIRFIFLQLQAWNGLYV